MVGSGALDDGFHEATAIVLDVDASVARLCGALGYELLWRGKASSGALDLMGLDPGVPGEEALIGDPARARGFIRLFAFPGRMSGVMRDGAQPWDIGGIFDINIRALRPIKPVHEAMTRAGFCAFAPITAFHFAGMDVKEVVDRDADGLAIALIERIAPPLTGFEAARGPASFVFNSSQIVPSLAAARAFAVDALGWTPVAEASWVHENGLNCMGFPPDVARTRRLKVAIFQAQGRNVGSVEFIEFEGESLDFSSAAPPDRGWAALRFPMTDVVGFIARAAAYGCTTLPPRVVTMQPYGQVKSAVAITPWGARLEAYRPV
jgi:catechol 2,3-dioxygenase-like lactoylglutathione lyase family enzyme